MIQAGTNLIIMLAAAFGLLFLDLWFFMQGRKTFSETVWTINQRTIAIAFIAGLLAGHLFTVPGALP